MTPSAAAAALTLLHRGKLAEAEQVLAGILQTQPDNADAHYYLGVIAQERRQLARASQCFARAIALHPSNGLYHVGLGRLRESEHNPAAAEAAYRRAIECDPSLVYPRLRVCELLARTRRYREVVAETEHILALDPGCLEAYDRKAIACFQSGAHEAAISACKAALEKEPHRAHTAGILAEVLKATGEIDTARQVLAGAIAAHPDSVQLRATLADLGGGTDDKKAFAVLESARADTRLGPTTRSQALFALGRMYEQKGDFARSFECYASGNAVTAASRTPYNYGSVKRTIDGILARFSGDFSADHEGTGLDSRVPVFIVGMPRSGTSLVEQIISAHPRVFGAGEIGAMASLLRAAGMDRRDNAVTPENIEHVGRSYLERLAALSGDAERVTDKMVFNMYYLGLIALVFPRAPILYCRRHPLDTCVSCYAQNFAQRNEFSTDLRSLGQHYRAHERLMAHWKAVLGSRILEIRYEHLVEDPGREIAGLLDFCGLEWDDRCARFYESSRAVKTASKLQVRSRIYKTSIGRWRNFEPFLGPLIDALQAHAGEVPERFRETV
ncbi:MAG: tetratricopeptide repeat protein [Chitinivibrionales bacterium]|nr:tetratricopeptide repeat protein [Chitinivibrionales bacterium]MBD3395241.1 tetratricopeptide repeat protein [Chitinivibrionales bacterium]